jgi:3-oxoisoapionate kinase
MRLEVPASPPTLSRKREREKGPGMTLRLAFYGDDFTGSTDALEVLAFAGLNCALFLKAPTPAMLDRFGALDAIGMAGDSRAMTPQEMDAALPTPLSALAKLAPIVHYKVCSTFDSAPTIGSIGRVIEIARRELGGSAVPIVAGNPALGRYGLFGNLFARSGTDGKVHRIDRHPIMSQHPVTPMDEADLSVHIARQGKLAIATLTLADLARGRAAVDAQWATLADTHDAVLIDSATPEHLTDVGRLIDKPLFVVGSSGVEYALTQWWRESGLPAADTRRFDACNAAGPVLVVSASASALTAMQIDAALAAGFADMPLNARDLIDADRAATVIDDVAAAASHQLAQGKSVILHTARGSTDPRIADMLGSLVGTGLTRAEATHQGGRRLGQRLGELTRAVLARQPLRRIVLSGGDTSSQVTQVLAPDALTVVARLAPGAPLCRLHAAGNDLDGLEVALKGGQMGDTDYFIKARDGVQPRRDA